MFNFYVVGWIFGCVKKQHVENNRSELEFIGMIRCSKEVQVYTGSKKKWLFIILCMLQLLVLWNIYS
jgi:hypothetical protein